MLLKSNCSTSTCLGQTACTMCSGPVGTRGTMTLGYMCCVAQHSTLTCRMEWNASVFTELLDAVVEVLPTLREQGISVYLLSEACNVTGINTLLNKISQASDEPLPRDLRANISIRSTALYIYTSGTTGTPPTTTEDTLVMFSPVSICCLVC